MSVSAAWRRALLGLFVLLAGLLLLYRDTALAMVEIWDRSETFAHAFVVPPIAVWLIWRRRAAMSQEAPQASPWFLLPFAGLGFLWLLGDLAAVNAATQLAFTGMLVLLVPAVLGWRVARHILFPLGFLFFAVPIGEFMMPRMMEWTADFTIAALRLSGVPVFREGLHFVIPTGHWSVVEACSGIRYLMASVMVGSLFAYLNYRSMRRRWLFVGVSILLPVIANWLRAYMIVMLGHLSGNELATGADHLVYGWVLFGIIMLALFMIGARWAEPDATLPEARAVALAGSTRGSNAMTVTVSVALVLLLFAPHLANRVLAVDEAPAPKLSSPDLGAQGWAIGDIGATLYKPSFVNPSAELEAGYAQPTGARVGLYIGYYRQQTYQSKLISSDNVLLKSTDPRWTQASAGVVTAGANLWQSVEMKALGQDAERSGMRLRVWKIYWINGRFTARDWEAKILGALGRLTGQGDDAAVIVVYAPSVASGQADRQLSHFVQANLPALQSWLAAVRGSTDRLHGQSGISVKGKE